MRSVSALITPPWSSQRYLKPTGHMVRERERERGGNRSLPRLPLLGFDVTEGILLTRQREGEGIEI